jgi:signal-transduction protein with cAMP-binding, CBS, and nucleotidyltransferase domain
VPHSSLVLAVIEAHSSGHETRWASKLAGWLAEPEVAEQARHAFGDAAFVVGRERHHDSVEVVLQVRMMASRLDVCSWMIIAK